VYKQSKEDTAPVYRLAGKNLKKLREERGLTQKELAEKLNLSIGLISRIERGENSLAPRHIASICKLFDVDPGYFYRTNAERDMETAKALLRNTVEIKDDGLVGEMLKDLQSFIGYLNTKYASGDKPSDKK
jgi:transcriptional regulator with XRE-family HTH domain